MSFIKLSLIGFVAINLIIKGESTVKAADGSTTATSFSPVVISATTLKQASDLSVSGDIKTAETLLLTQITAPAQTLLWYQESGRLLMRLTAKLAAERQLAAQRVVAQDALGYFSMAETATTHSGVLSNIVLNEAVIQEQYLDEPDAAKANYQRAIAADPKNEKASDALARIKMREENSRANGKRGNGS